jgi:hypothetical protein
MSPPNARRARSRGAGRRWAVPVGRGKSAIGVAATFIGLVSGFLALVFVVWPDLQPRPAEPATKAAATLTSLSLEPRITRGQFLKRIDQAATGFTEQQLAAQGAFVRFRVELKGFRQIPLTLKRELVDARSRDEVSEISPITITPPVNEIARDWHDWIPLSARRGRYFLIIKLIRDGETAPLATLETAEFRGLD